MPPAIINVCRLSEEINTPLEAAQRQAAALLLFFACITVLPYVYSRVKVCHIEAG